MKKEQAKKVADAAKDVEKPRYEATPIENKAIAAYKAAQEKRGPRLKVAIEGDAAKINPDHPDVAIGTLALMQAIGTVDLDFFDGLTWQLLNASRGQGSPEKTVNFMLAVIKGIEPRDQIEAVLGAQMAAVHMASMTFARRLANVENIPQQDSAQNAFNKLTRTFAAQVEALKLYRSYGEQKMTVQHVHVADGGQAIVGNISTPAPGVGAKEKVRNNPMLLDMHQALRCRAKSKRSGKQCQSPAVRGCSVCRMHGAGGGAPRGNSNERKQGLHSAEAIGMQRVVGALTRLAREAMAGIE